MCLWNIPCKALCSSKMGVWNGYQTMWDLFQTLVFNVENLPFIVSRTLVACAGPCLHMQVLACLCRSKVSLAFIFQKEIYLLTKSYIFHFNIFLSQFVIWLGPKPILGFRISVSLGTGARVVRGTKFSVYMKVIKEFTIIKEFMKDAHAHSVSRF